MRKIRKNNRWYSVSSIRFPLWSNRSPSACAPLRQQSWQYTANITFPLLSFVYCLSSDWYTDSLTMCLYSTCHSGDPISARAGINLYNINGFLTCGIWSKNVSPLREGSINAKHTKALIWLQNKREYEDWTWWQKVCVWVISIYKQTSGETFHCSNASFWQRGLFLAGHACQSLKTSFSSLWIVKYSQINNSGDLFTRHTSGPCFARGGPEHRRGQAAPAGSFERLTGQGRFRPGPLPRNSSREGGATCCHHWEGGGRSCVLLVWQGVGPLH